MAVSINPILSVTGLVFRPARAVLRLFSADRQLFKFSSRILGPIAAPCGAERIPPRRRFNAGRATVSGLLWLLVLSLPVSVRAQEYPCDSGLESRARGPHGYRLRGDRCEGLYVEQVGGTTLFVASLTEYFEDYRLTSGDDLIVEWTGPGDSGVRLRAGGIKRGLYYRMDTVRPPGSTSYAWPTGILAAQRIGRGDIGVVGWTRYSVGGTDRDVYVPLRIRQQHKAIRRGAYQFVLFPGVKLEEVYISLASLGADGRPEAFLKEDEPLRYGYYPAERPIRIEISGLDAPGIYYLGIGTRLSRGGSVALEYWIYHPGQ